MGLGSRRPKLPAPTESSIQDSVEELSPVTDLATDISRVTDRTSHTIPVDGTPITVTTASKRPLSGKLTKLDQPSQTSLLIEYYEGNVKVRVRPSLSSKSQKVAELVENGKQPVYTRKVSFGSDRALRTVDPGSVSSYDSVTHLQRTSMAPTEAQLLARSRGDISGGSASPEPRYIVAASDISSMPPESEVNAATTGVSTFRDDDILLKKKVQMPKPRLNASNERFSQKVIEKIANKPRMSNSERKRYDSTTYEDRELVEGEPRNGIRSRVIEKAAGSWVSPSQRSTDQVSYKSGASQTSLTNNPKLLRTVEDAIRRLIMPELEEIKKKQKSSKSAKYEREPSDYSESSVSRDEYERRVSSGSRRRHRKQKDIDVDSPSDRSYQRRESVDSLSTDEHYGLSRREKGSHRVRDVAAGALAGAAVMEMKHHHDQNGEEREERRRRRRRSKSRSSRSSRSASMTESEGIFHKHDVPPMPMMSDLGSDLTRSSLLSSRTGGTATPIQREVREVVRGSPLETTPPASQTPSRTPVDLKRGLGTHHGNLSEHDLSSSRVDVHETELQDSPQSKDKYLAAAAGGLGALAAHQLLTDPERVRKYESNLHQQHPIRRGLSPIQSVASYQTTEANRNSILQPRSAESLNSLSKNRQLNPEKSIESFSSAPNVDVAYAKRPAGISLENRSEVMKPHEDRLVNGVRGIGDDQFFDEQHSQNEQYRHSFESNEPEMGDRDLTNYTNDSLDEPYLDKVTAGQQVAWARAANPEFNDPSTDVESAVASLYEPSVLSNGRSPTQSYTDSMSRRDVDSPRSIRQGYVSGSGSPLKEQHFAYSQEDIANEHHTRALSPPHSVTRSLSLAEAAEEAPIGVLAVSHDAQAANSPESEITTNPSPIQGPITDGERTQQDFPVPKSRSRSALTSPAAQGRNVPLTGAAVVNETFGPGYIPSNNSKNDIYSRSQTVPTPPGARPDEGYFTADNPRSPIYSPKLRPLGGAPGKAPSERNRSFVQETEPYIEPLARGLQSPHYDNATGQGKENIQSRDIVALMDHLTVRDAHRNARDTEILVTLVRSAAEMRNSFEDMQRFISEQNEMILDTSDKQHATTQKVVGGPRPLPATTARQGRSIESEEDASTKQRSIFRRALQGLGSKNTKELQNIEGMLMQLLNEVEGLRAVQGDHSSPAAMPKNALSSVDNVRGSTDPGYEPEGQAGTSSTGDRSGFFSNNSSRQADYRGYRRESGNRVSTVMEGDEYEDNLAVSNGAQQFAETNQASYDTIPVTRGLSGPEVTPPRTYQPASQDNTPQLSTGGTGNRKYKSGASSFLPRISRWSKTTASSVADNFRSSNQTQATNQQRPFSGVSRSGSDLGEFTYDPEGDDHLDYHDENRPPSPLIPSQVSEKPKYQAHRDSQNLQHPQPRQGPTGRYQHQLESEAMNYEDDPFSPTSQTSGYHWDQQRPLATGDPNIPSAQQPYVAQPPLSPISDNYSETSTEREYGQQQHQRPASFRSGTSSQSYDSQQPPSRPPKINYDDPLLPQRPPKVPMTPPPAASRQVTYADHVAAARAGSPAFDKVCSHSALCTALVQKANWLIFFTIVSHRRNPQPSCSRWPSRIWRIRWKQETVRPATDVRAIQGRSGQRQEDEIQGQSSSYQQ